MPTGSGAVLLGCDHRTYNGRDKEGAPNYGGYSERIVVDENYVLRMPKNLPLEACAPLLCAGITCYSPLKHWNAGPGKKGRD